MSHRLVIPRQPHTCPPPVALIFWVVLLVLQFHPLPLFLITVANHVFSPCSTLRDFKLQRKRLVNFQLPVFNARVEESGKWSLRDKSTLTHDGRDKQWKFLEISLFQFQFLNFVRDATSTEIATEISF